MSTLILDCSNVKSALTYLNLSNRVTVQSRGLKGSCDTFHAFEMKHIYWELTSIKIWIIVTGLTFLKNIKTIVVKYYCSAWINTCNVFVRYCFCFQCSVFLQNLGRRVNVLNGRKWTLKLFGMDVVFLEWNTHKTTPIPSNKKPGIQKKTNNLQLKSLAKQK